MRSRKTVRAAISTAITNYFTAVYQGPRRKFNGVAPIAVILSAGEENHFETRGGGTPDWNTYHFFTNIYVRVDEGQESTCEDVLDDLRDAVGTALRQAGFLVGE